MKENVFKDELNHLFICTHSHQGVCNKAHVHANGRCLKSLGQIGARFFNHIFRGPLSML